MERKEKERELLENGESVKEQAKERHEAEVARLLEELNRLKEELNVSKKQNTDDETKLNEKYVQADKGYSEALETYDNEMRDHNKQKDIVTKEYEDQALAGSRDFTSTKIPGFLKLKSRDFSGSIVTMFWTPWNTLTPKIGNIDKNVFHFLQG